MSPEQHFTGFPIKDLQLILKISELFSIVTGIAIIFVCIQIENSLKYSIHGIIQQKCHIYLCHQTSEGDG